MNRNLKLTWVAVTLVVGVILFCMMSSNIDIASQQKKNTNSPVDDLLLSKSEERKKVDLPPDETIDSIPSPTPVEMERYEEAAGSNGESHPLTFNIVDALDEPISSGLVQFGTASLPFANGNLSIPHCPPSIVRASVSSEGYEKKDIPIDSTNISMVRVCLEYQTNFHIQVYWDEEFQTPAPNVSVVLRKGGNVLRPLLDRLDFHYIARGYVSLQGNLIFDGDRILVSHAPFGPQSFDPIFGGGWGDLLTNDRIVGLSGLLWDNDIQPAYNPMPFIHKRLNRNSARLRIYDGLAAYKSHPTRSTEDKDYIEIQRGNERLYVCLGKMKEATLGAVIQERETGPDGSCVFENLPAGSYYAQAVNGDLRSSIAFLHPAKGGESVYLARSFSNVTIKAKRAGLSKALASIENADVRLQPKHPSASSMPLSGKTDKFGKIVFPSVPFGTYLLIVRPLEGNGEEIHQEQLEINEPKHEFFALFEHSGYTVSGVVREIETKDLIEGFTLQLYRTSDPMGEHSVVKTDTEGRFVFQNVPSGKYVLIPILTKENDRGVIPAFIADVPPILSTPIESSMERSQVGYRSSRTEVLRQSVQNRIAGGWIGDGNNRIMRFIPLNEQKLEVRDTDVVNVRYPVVYKDLTVVSGQVLLNEKPQENTVVKIECQDVRFLENPVLSDSEGRYSISLYASSDLKNYEARISAMVYDRLENVYLSLLNPFVLNRVDYTAKGVENIEFQSGENKDNVNIYIRENENDYTIRGRLICENYSKLNGIKIDAKQNNEPLKTTISDGGVYEISNLEPGRVSLSIQPPVYAIDSPHMGKRPFTDYCNVNETFAISSIHKVVEKDIPLIPATYMTGRLVREDNTPLVDVQLRAEIRAKRQFRSGTTDGNGYFWLWGIEPNAKYSLSAITADRQRPTLIPNLTNGGIEDRTVVAIFNTQ